MKALKPDLERRKLAHLYRRRRVASEACGVEQCIDGERMLNFCSNDYLGLASHPEVITAMTRGAQRYGAGSGSAHLVSGHSEAHHRLEAELAEFVGRPRALLFSTGYMANLGAVTGLVDRGDSVYQDRLNHASLIDAGVLSRARLKRFAHSDCTALERQLAAHGRGRALVVTDGVFSMDGDLAPLPRMAELCHQHNAWLMVDDAHGFGVLGARGAGTLELQRLTAAQVPVLVCTLGKALGTFGAFVAGSEELIETLIQRARSYVYTTALPPSVAEATRASLKLVAEEPWRRERLAAMIKRFRDEVIRIGLPLMDSSTPIQPIVAGSAARALEWSRQLQRQGILVTAIRPPTVPEGSARLRVTLSAAHSDAQLARLLEALAALPQERPR